MRIAIIGTRGVPARYGGFETCAEELGKRLVTRGHEVYVYCRHGYYQQKLPRYEGINLIYTSGIERRSLDTLSYTLLSLLHASRCSYDILLIFNVANGPLLLWPRLWRKKVIVNVDGLEWEREKWNIWGKLYYRLAARITTLLANALVADSRAIQNYYSKIWKKETVYIPYGASIEKSSNPQLLQRFGLKPREYFLQITRFEPENNPLLTVRAFEKLETEKKLVLVGGAKYPSSYFRRLLSTQDKRIIFPGFIYDKNLIRELLTNCLAYIHGNEAGGTNPALLQAMGCGALVIARDVVFNREVLRQAGLYYKKDIGDLMGKMRWVLENESHLDPFRERAQEIIASDYQWDKVVDAYEELFFQIARGRS